MPTSTNPQDAIDRLVAGHVVAFPTETVYGLGAMASNDNAVAAVFELKGRPADHPLIIHLPDATQLGDWAQDVPSVAMELAEACMPGPLTLVLPRKAGVAERAAGNRPTVALRVPAHEMARRLLEGVGGALVAPSANLFGRPSPTCAAHVSDDFAGTDLLVLDGGPTMHGVESTVVGLSEPGKPVLLRPGALAREVIEKFTGPLAMAGKAGGAPGTLPSHYAPRQPLHLLDREHFAAQSSHRPAGSVAALGFERPPGITDDMWRQLPAEPTAAARLLYGHLRQLEGTGASVIIAQQPPAGDEWSVVRDRLSRAAQPRSP